MTVNGLAQIGLFFFVLVALVKPLGWYMARVYTGQACGMDRVMGPFERLIYRVCGVRATEEMDWKTYAVAMLLFNVTGLVALYALQRLQGYLPLNPAGFGAVAPDLAFNTASSFITNTNWQAYAGESMLSYLTQMLGLTVQNFVSAATGMAILVALIRGLTAQTAATIGNFWVDLTRSTLYILLPLSAVLALLLVSQGTVQTFGSSHHTTLLQSVTYEKPIVDAMGQPVLDEKGAAKPESTAGTEQALAVGPVASQVAIKHLGTNGGGFFNANAAHPYENPTPLTDFMLILAETVIAAALTYTFGTMVGDTRQGWAILAAMLSVLALFVLVAYWAESAGNPRLAMLGVEQTAGSAQSGGNMEGKEVRFGVARSALFATATTATSTGAVNAMHDSFTPLGGLVPLFMMQFGEVIVGGVGSGLYGMLIFAIIGTIFSDILQPGTRFSVTNFSSPRVAEMLQAWALPRFTASGVFRTLARHRLDKLLGGAWSTLASDGPFFVRNFRVVMSVGIGQGSNLTNDDLVTMRDGIISALESINVPVRQFAPIDLIRLFDEILAPSNGAGDEVPGSGTLHRRQRQPHRRGDEVLAQSGEDPLREHEGGPPGDPGQHRLGDDRRHEEADEHVDPAQARRAGRDLLDDLPDHPGADEGDEGSDAVPQQHPRQGAAVVAQQHLRVLSHGRARRDRQGAGGVVGAPEQR